MDTVDPLRFLFAFLFVIALIGALALLLKRYGGAKFFTPAQTGGRIDIVETRHIDARRKLVLIRRDDKEHLLLLAGDRETLVESGIEGKHE